jgi:hypothetical protein
MELEIIVFGEISQAKKQEYFMTLWNIKKVGLKEARLTMEGGREGGEGGMRKVQSMDIKL